LVRVSAGLLSAAIAISCSHDEDKVSEKVGSVQQAAALAGAGGADPGVPGLGGAPDLGGAPSAGGAADGGAGGQPAICDVATCEGPNSCTHCVNNQCVPWGAGQHVCRPEADLCDAAEVCDGSPTCPKDDVKPQGTDCRAQNGSACDAKDTCDGQVRECVDKKLPDTTVCNPIKANSSCDKPEYCTGTTDLCPKDEFKLDTEVCRIQQGDCDVSDKCTGDSPDCPGDGKAADGLDCDDNANKCLVPGTTKCLAGACTVGTAVVCAAPVNTCLDPGICNQQSGICAYNPKPAITPCDDGIACTVGDHCGNGACISGQTTDSVCPQDQHKCAAVTCDPTATQFPDRCKIVPVAAGIQCNPVALGDNCDQPEQCNGTSPDCPADKVKPQGTPCLAASCTNFQSQVALVCDGTARKCAAASPVSCNGYACDGLLCGQACDDDDGCQPDHYCVNNTCELRIGAGEACKDDSQCSTSNPNCVDGVCCNTTCKGQCEACDIAGQEGTCSIVTGAPHGERTACRGDGSACNGVCAGKLRSACDFPSPQTVCLQAACDPVSSTAVEEAFCDGAGSCAATDPMDCTPFSCGATACRGNCVSDAQCATGAFCKAGICEELQKPGDRCARDAQCASGFCTDGVCCDGRCDGQCEACGGGKCSAVTGAPVGTRPACAGEEGDACAGACDGGLRTGCAYPGGEIVCRDASCDAGAATVLAHCAGAGACAPAQTVTCANGCEGTICAGDGCLLNSDCKDGEHCIAGTCAPQGSDGAACGAAGDCESGFCVDGVCCDKACDGQCEACDGAKKPGVCAPISGAPHGARASCTSDGSACGGACDGRDPLGCSYPNGTVCSAGSCTPGQDGNEAVATVEASCNGSGRCPTPRDQACGGFGCDAQEQLCNGDCADGSACPGGQYCSAGVCAATVPTGTACQAGAECASGFCVDGYCCGSACDDRCAACDVPGLLGKCSPVSGSTHGGRPGCQGGGVCGAQCDGKNVTDCAFPDDGTSCGEPYCNSGTAVAASACDGAGQCRAGEETACASFSCDGNECADDCTTDADCTRDLQCQQNKCVEAFKINAVDQGTCGCKVPGGRPEQHGAWLALAAVSLWSLRRRRAAPRASEGLR